MRLNVNWNDEAQVKRLFTWMSKSGMAPRFGSRPVGWFQVHMDHAIKLLEKALKDKGLPPTTDLSIKNGNVVAGDVLVAVASDIYRRADRLSRGEAPKTSEVVMAGKQPWKMTADQWRPKTPFKMENWTDIPFKVKKNPDGAPFMRPVPLRGAKKVTIPTAPKHTFWAWQSGPHSFVFIYDGMSGWLVGNGETLQEAIDNVGRKIEQMGVSDFENIARRTFERNHKDIVDQAKAEGLVKAASVERSKIASALVRLAREIVSAPILTNPEIDAAIKKYVETVEANLLERHRREYPKQSEPVLEIMWGQRYARIVKTDKNKVSRSAFGFVDRTNGDILKAASWKAPAPHARGSVLKPETWGPSHGPYGMTYLR